jgi:GNAT superfamily N-acetyltransferase
MPLPESMLVGPRVATPDDIPSLNRVFSDAFTERYHRDGLVGVRVPQLNPDVWRYAIRDAGDGAMLWYDEHERLVAFNIAHRSGIEGWMGPLAVRTDRQEAGIGRTIVATAIAWLSEHGAAVVGLETMPRTVDNIGFYSRLGFRPGHLTITLTGDVVEGYDAAVRLSMLHPDARDGVIAACREGLSAVAAGHDYGREMLLTEELSLGDTVIATRGSVVEGFAVCHTVSLALGRRADEVRILKLFAASAAAFDRVVAGVESLAAQTGIGRVAIRCQSAYGDAYRGLIERGYTVRWTDLRMTLDGHAEPEFPRGAVVLSNWEI